MSPQGILYHAGTAMLNSRSDREHFTGQGKPRVLQEVVSALFRGRECNCTGFEISSISKESNIQ
jgi:hypothetical protein